MSSPSWSSSLVLLISPPPAADGAAAAGGNRSSPLPTLDDDDDSPPGLLLLIIASGMMFTGDAECAPLIIARHHLFLAGCRLAFTLIYMRPSSEYALQRTMLY